VLALTNFHHYRHHRTCINKIQSSLNSFQIQKKVYVFSDMSAIFSNNAADNFLLFMPKRHKLIFKQEILISDFQRRHLQYGINNITQTTTVRVLSRILHVWYHEYCTCVITNTVRVLSRILYVLSRKLYTCCHEYSTCVVTNTVRVLSRILYVFVTNTVRVLSRIP